MLYQPQGLRELRVYQLAKQFKPTDETRLLDLYNQIWNTLGALIRSLKEKKGNDSWDRSYKVLKEDEELYDL